MSAYFYWSGLFFHVIATVMLSLFLMLKFVEWYLDVFKMKKRFLRWAWEDMKQRNRDGKKAW